MQIHSQQICAKVFQWWRLIFWGLVLLSCFVPRCPSAWVNGSLDRNGAEDPLLQADIQVTPCEVTLSRCHS